MDWNVLAKIIFLSRSLLIAVVFLLKFNEFFLSFLSFEFFLHDPQYSKNITFAVQEIIKLKKV
ncbi:MAG: hypothetical protein CMP79_00090 [Formosa sp.]|nr:hypothetical protein [Formosa sp.]